ncbi:MAG: hypothetical protein NT120_04115, partial [Candidatus Aenigmarchaeota archaeon]|nr:hypothetical protein [Candidatus Aenigmarchaeota archaeon]
ILLPFLNASYPDYSTKLVNNTGIVNMGNANYTVQRTGDELQINGMACKSTCLQNIDSKIFSISTNNDNVHFVRIAAMLPVSLPFVGNTLGWLGWYILASIPLVILIRKLLKIYV